jgi:diguanylate cyclase (GGDEF)-like protein
MSRWRQVCQGAVSGMRLDVPTLLVVLAAVLQMAAIALALSKPLRHMARHTTLWAVALQLSAISCGLILLRGIVPNLVSIPLANACLLLAYGLAWNGARAFNGRALCWTAILVAPAIWLLVLPLPFFADALAHRIALLSILASAMSLALAWEIWARGKDDLRWRTPFAAVAAIHGLFLILRAGLALSQEMPLDFFAGRSAALLGIGLLEPILMMFAAIFVGLRLSDERLKNILKRAASVDGLTGLLNHGAFMDQARAQVEQARAEGTDVTLILFDLDHFKQLNDRFGHAAGDSALRLFARAVRNEIADVHLVGRVGGEEFAALLVGCGPDAGAAIGERIRAAVAAERLDHAGQTIAITVSVGMMAARDNDVEFETLMEAADAALYAAKRGGRDLVCLAPMRA